MKNHETFVLNIKQVKKDYIDNYKRKQGIPDTEKIKELLRLYHILLENVLPQPLKQGITSIVYKKRFVPYCFIFTLIPHRYILIYIDIYKVLE